MNTTSCTCGNCPSTRMARGLAPFCQMARTDLNQGKGGFGSWQAAVEALKPGQKIRAVGGLGTGSARRFVLVGA